MVICTLPVIPTKRCNLNSLWTTLLNRKYILSSLKILSKIYVCPHVSRGFQVAQWVKNLPAMQETQIRSLGRGSPEKEMATHSSIIA